MFLEAHMKEPSNLLVDFVEILAVMIVEELVAVEQQLVEELVAVEQFLVVAALVAVPALLLLIVLK